MPIRRYRSVEEIPEPPAPRSTLESLANACRLGRLSRSFGHDTRAPRGVRTFRSVQEAHEHRLEWESARPEPI